MLGEEDNTTKRIVHLSQFNKKIVAGRICHGEKTQALAAEYGICIRTVQRIFNQFLQEMASAKEAAALFYSNRAAGGLRRHLSATT